MTIVDLGPHAGFIVAAYAVAALVTALVFWAVADDRAQRRLIADLEAQGVTRRSQRIETP